MNILSFLQRTAERNVLHPLDDPSDVTHTVESCYHRCAIPAPFGFAIRNGEVFSWGSKTRIGVRRVLQCEFRLQACASGPPSLLMPLVIPSSSQHENQQEWMRQRSYRITWPRDVSSCAITCEEAGAGSSLRPEGVDSPYLRPTAGRARVSNRTRPPHTPLVVRQTGVTIAVGDGSLSRYPCPGVWERPLGARVMYKSRDDRKGRGKGDVRCGRLLDRRIESVRGRGGKTIHGESCGKVREYRRITHHHPGHLLTMPLLAGYQTPWSR